MLMVGITVLTPLTIFVIPIMITTIIEVTGAIGMTTDGIGVDTIVPIGEKNRTEKIPVTVSEAGVNGVGGADNRVSCRLELMPANSRSVQAKFSSNYLITNLMDDMNDSATALSIESLKVLEYSIRNSITVREDQEENAEPQHKAEAERYGIRSDALTTKGDLLNTVQTALRSAQAVAGKNNHDV
jgi:hypothetical protein